MVDISKMMPSLEEDAMLCHVKVNFYGFRKYDSEVSNKACEEFDADKDSGRFNKSLIEREGLQFLGGIARTIRRYHRRNTLPWLDGDDDYRILPSAHYIEYSKGLRKLVEEFGHIADDFHAQLPLLYKRAQKKRGKMYKAEDYPDPETVRAKYNVTVKIKPVPIGKDFRVKKLSPEIRAEIQKEIDTDRNDAVKEAMKNLWGRLQLPIKKMVEKLNDDESIFRDSLVENISDIVELISKLNLGDQELEKFGKEVRKKLCTVDPKELRKDTQLRNDTRKAAKDILKRMAGYC